MNLLIVIVNYRTAELTVGCLASLATEVPSVPGTRVVVVDNGSADGSAEAIEKAIEQGGWGAWARVVPLGANAGFAGGTNLGIRTAAAPRYVLLLNSDTIVHRGCLDHCRAVMDADPTIGAMSCLLLNADGSVQRVARRFPTPLRQIACALGLPWHAPRLFAWADPEDATWDQRRTKRDVDWLGGAFLFVRGELIDRIGGLDEDFFFYGEDIEFCHRIRRAGYRCHYDPAVAITHLGGGSSDETRLATPEQQRHRRRARYLVQRKCYGRSAAWLVRMVDGAMRRLRQGHGRFAGPSRRSAGMNGGKDAMVRNLEQHGGRGGDRERGDRALRVLFALPGLHRVNRGAEVAFESLAHELARRPGFQVTLVGSGLPREDRDYTFRHAGSIPRERFERWPNVPLLRHEYAYEELTFVPGLLHAFRPETCDVTVTCSYPYTNWALRARRGRSRRPAHVFVTQNGDWPAHARHREYRFFSCEGLVCTNVDYYERNRDRWRCGLIPNGVRTEVFRPGPADRAEWGLPAGVPVVLMVSALVPSKRVLEGIAAVAEVPSVFLVLAGDGPLRDCVDAFGAERLGSRFRRLVVAPERMPGLYRAADVFLHMSRDEPFGNVYIEALATGLPVVAHDRSTTRWILEDEGILVDTAEAALVAAAVRGGLERRGPEAQAARRRLAERRFAWSRVADAYGAFLSQVAERARGVA